MAHLNDEACPACGEETVYWRAKDETEKIWELYMDCDGRNDDGCGREFPKIVVNKSEDTTYDAFEERLKQRLESYRGSS